MIKTIIIVKKLLTIVIALTAISFSAKAQWYAGGSVGLDLQAGSGVTDFSFVLSPEAGYNFNDKLAAGIAIPFGPTIVGTDGASNTSFAFSFNPYVRYSFFKTGSFKVFADAIAEFGAVTSSSAAFSWGVGVRPGFSYDLNKKLSLRCHFGRLGFYGVEKHGAFRLSILNDVSLGIFKSF